MVVYVFLLSRFPTFWRFILAGYFSNALYNDISSAYTLLISSLNLLIPTICLPKILQEQGFAVGIEIQVARRRVSNQPPTSKCV